MVVYPLPSASAAASTSTSDSFAQSSESTTPPGPIPPRPYPHYAEHFHPPPDIDAQRNVFRPLTTARDLSRATFSTFYNQRLTQWCTPFNEAGTIDEQHGYTCWPAAIGTWAVANAVKRGALPADALAQAVSGLDRHWSEDLQGFCAWHLYPGNDDIYYDDNAHAGNALVTAFEATREPAYLSRAGQLVRGILREGWDSDGEGGMAWHRGELGSFNACSTLAAAVLAARLALLGVDVAFCTHMARSCVAFAEHRLIDPYDGLVWDAWQLRDDGSWGIDSRKFTYNTGFSIHAYVLLFQLTGERKFLGKARSMAISSIRPRAELMDQTLQPQDRVWKDVTFFAAHLVEAMVLLAKADGPDSAVARQFEEFLKKLGTWTRVWTGDPSDGLFFRQLRPWLISQGRTIGVSRKYGVNVTFEPDEGEREQSEEPVGERQLIKTLLANASMANMYFYLSDLTDEVDLPGEWKLSEAGP